MIFSNDRTANDALLNTLGEEQAAAWVRFYAVADPVNLSTTERSPLPRDWAPLSALPTRPQWFLGGLLSINGVFCKHPEVSVNLHPKPGSALIDASTDAISGMEVDHGKEGRSP
jgi:hypothetical protein